MRYWIYDNDSTPQGHPLRRLIARVLEVCGHRETLQIVKAQGYGLQITEWMLTLDSQEHIDVSTERLMQISEGSTEWFYDLEARLPDVDVVFGLHDSAELFIEASDDVVSQVCGVFAQVAPAGPKRKMPT